MDPAAYSTVDVQAAAGQMLDDGLREWIGQYDAEYCLSTMDDMGVVASKVYHIDDILADPVFAERDIIVSVDDDELGPVRMQGVIPQFATSPSAVWRTGPALGPDNNLVYQQWLDLDENALTTLRSQHII